MLKRKEGRKINEGFMSGHRSQLEDASMTNFGSILGQFCRKILRTGMNFKPLKKMAIHEYCDNREIGR